MMLSISRRTDIPSFYMPWLMERLRAGWALVRNPMNHGQVSRIDLSPEGIEGMVFWSKNPRPMLAHLKDLSPYPYYVQFTLNPYGPELERNLPEKAALVDTFQRLADALGSQRVMWRYSPVILGGDYAESFHLRAFDRLSSALEGYTSRCRLSFLDVYRKIRPRMAAMGIGEATGAQKQGIFRALASIAAGRGISLEACGNFTPVDPPGAEGLLAPPPSSGGGCIDGALLGAIANRTFSRKKDPGQPAHCSCLASVDLGSYNTCMNGCAYCYANVADPRGTLGKCAAYDPLAPMLCDDLRPEDVVTDRKVKNTGSTQTTLF